MSDGDLSGQLSVQVVGEIASTNTGGSQFVTQYFLPYSSALGYQNRE